MPRKKTYEEVKSAFEERRFVLLSKEYTGSQHKLNAMCPKGHIVQMSLNSISNGDGCGKCHKENTVPSLNDVRLEFANRSYTLISTEYVSNHSKLEYRCPQGHHGSISRANFLAGKGCPECKRIKLSGEGNWRWNPNITDEERLHKRWYPEYYLFRRSVFERDNYTCQICTIRSAKGVRVVVEAHHLESYHANRSLRTEVTNGITLCHECHCDFHKEYGRTNNTTEQFSEFYKQRTGTDFIAPLTAVFFNAQNIE